MNKLEQIMAHSREWAGCTRCGMSRPACFPGRQLEPFYGAGNPQARLFIVLDAPTPSQRHACDAFAGREGRLLQETLSRLGVSPGEVFISFLSSCTPYEADGSVGAVSSEAIAACKARLFEQLRIVDPCFVLILGARALKALVPAKVTLAALQKDVRLPSVLVSIPGVYATALEYPAIATWPPGQVTAKFSSGSDAPPTQFWMRVRKAVLLADAYAEAYGLGPPPEARRETRL